MRVRDDLGLDGLEVACVGRRRRGLALRLDVDARVEEAAAVGKLQHRVAASAAVPSGRHRVQGERQACARRLLRRRRNDGAEGGCPRVVVAVAVAVAACANSKVVGDLLHRSGRISSEVVVQRSSSPPTVPASSCASAKGAPEGEMKFLGRGKEEKGLGEGEGKEEDASKYYAFSLYAIIREKGGRAAQ